MTDLRRHVPPLTLVWDDEAPGALHRTVDGTLVFADVSGFTALTERLSRQGRIGAEEIVEALNRVFGPMLTIAAARGGELLKFGGDALLFLFRGEGHPEQACDAAVEMRASLRAAAAVPTSAGRFSLSMSVGVHAGDIQLFLVGSPTRELLVLGPGASAVATAEKAAEAGEVVVSPATATRLAPGSIRPRDDGALLLRRRGPHTEPSRPASGPPDHEDRLPTLFPVALGEYLALRAARPGAPGRDDRLRAVLRHGCRSRTVRPAGPCRVAARAGQHGRGSPRRRGRHAAGDRPRHRRRQVLPRLGGAQHPHRRRGRDAARAAAGGRCRPAPSAAARGRPRERLRGRGRCCRAGGLLRDGRHHEHRGADHGHRTTRHGARTPVGARPLAHPVRGDAARPVPDEGQGRPVLVYEVGEELGSRESVDDTRLPFLGRDAELRPRPRRPRPRPLRRGRGAHRRGAGRHRQHAAGAGGPRRRRRHPPPRAAGRAVRGVERLPRAARPAARAARHRARHPRGDGRGPAHGAGRPGARAAADGTAARRRRARRCARHPGGRPGRRAVPRRPGGRRRRRAARHAVTRPAGRRGRGRPLGRRRLGAPAGPAGVRDVGAALGSGRRAAWGARRLHAGIRHPHRARPAAARSRRAARQRRHRSHALAPARGRRRGVEGRRQPAVRRGGHPPRPGRRLARGAARVGAGGDGRPGR